ncbi:MAG: hypothetical protein AAB071_06400 [Bacteroidota bacterium]
MSYIFSYFPELFFFFEKEKSAIRGGEEANLSRLVGKEKSVIEHSA